MHSIHSNKEWQSGLSSQQQSPLQTPPIAVVDSSSSPKPTHVYASSSVSSPHHGDYSPSSADTAASSGSYSIQQAYSPPESDTANSSSSRLPGMIAHSQPGTPRPDGQQQHQDAPLYHPPAPFSGRNVVRGRANLFATEVGPYFSSTKPFDNLYASDKSTILSVRVQSKMDRGFFLADNDWTCYRRNYFQVSSVFSLHGISHYYSVNEPHVLVKTDNGVLAPVQRFLLGISARVTNNEKEIDLIQHTPKRDKGPQYKPEPKPITPGGNLTMSSVANNQNIVTFERVQFKTATANNGKRRAAQQYYVCVVNLFAETERGERIKVGSCQSAPLVVRGRSPGHYADSGQDRQPYPTNVSAPGGPSSMPEPMTPQPNGVSIKTDGYPYLKQEASQLPPPMMHQHSYEHGGHHQQQQAPPPPPSQPSYTYYSPYPQYASAVQTSQHMPNNVSSPLAQPPLPSPYTHHAGVPNYAVHDASHPDPYASDVYHGNNSHHHHSNSTEEPKMHHPFHMQQTGPIESPHSGYDWQRARYNSSSSGSSSVPSPGGHQGEPQQAYFQQESNRSYSPTTPTYATANNVINSSTAAARKYNSGGVPNLMK